MSKIYKITALIGKVMHAFVPTTPQKALNELTLRDCLEKNDLTQLQQFVSTLSPVESQKLFSKKINDQRICMGWAKSQEAKEIIESYCDNQATKQLSQHRRYF